ncbi:hypothetical protein LCI18_014210 [Fusarium solani-melongenae]|uniref:Uncharacterized protein n=1 Tax=Fusarium solani subsp. cucurbitae TaxID=2747967 RepID=A0ACD3ZPW6_FUSSC|nr:hypothetical protein LCI18_014210 [Fusarium solani-melongenae]
MEYSNPIIPGFAPDPSMVLVEGIFYLATSSFHLYPGIPIYASRDLQNWTHISNAFHRPEQLSLRHGSTFPIPLHDGGRALASGGLFAPTIRYHQGRFYIICTNASTAPKFKVENFFLWTDDIWNGSWSDPIPFAFRGIDPSLFFEDDKTYVQGAFSLGMGKHPSCTIKQFEIDIVTGKPLTEPKEIWAGHSRIDTEGPHIYQKDGWYYLLAAEGGTFEHHMLSIARSKDIWGPYEGFEGNPIMTSDGKPGELIQSIGHGELVEDATGQWWAVVLGVRKMHGSHPLGRETFLTPVHWPEGGWPLVSQPREFFKAPEVVPGGGTRAQDLFEEKISKVPGDVDYLYIRDPEPKCYRFSNKEDGRITLHPSLTDLSQPSGTSTFVGRRQRSFDAVAEATIVLGTIRPGETHVVTGLSVYKHHLHHVSLRYEASTGRVTFYGENKTTGMSWDTGMSLIVLEGDMLLDLKIEASATEYRGYARVQSRNNSTIDEWTDLGSWQTVGFTANEMTGPILGIFANSPRESDRSRDVIFNKMDVGMRF